VQAPTKSELVINLKTAREAEYFSNGTGQADKQNARRANHWSAERQATLGTRQEKALLGP
jgi:hypothetical protein